MTSTPTLYFMKPSIAQSCRSLFALMLGLGLCLFAQATQAATATLVASNSTWRFLADGSDQGAAWRDPVFDDSGWSNGVAKLGFGGDGEVTSIGSATNGFVTFYFRHNFVDPGTNAYTQLQARLLRDDGAVVYLNGAEIFRQNMPAGSVSYLTQASAAVNGGAENVFFATNLPGALLLLQPGVNTLAVEVHQNTNNSPDLGFNFELTAVLDNSPPALLNTNQPASGSVLQGRSFSLTVAADGTPPLSYQWFFDNGFGVIQPIPTATNATYNIANMQAGDAGSYFAIVANAFGSTNSPAATVEFIPDFDPPIIVSLNSVTNNRIGVCFSEPVTLPSAIDPMNYVVDAGLASVTGVVLRDDGRSVELVLGSHIEEFFSVAVANIEDLAGNVAADAKTGYMSQYNSTTVGTSANPNPPGSVYSCFWDTFEVTVGGDIGGTADHFHFIEKEVVGNFDARVRVTRLDPASPTSKAGLMARETLAADSRSLQTYFTPVAGANEIEVAVRAIPGGATTDAGFQMGARAPADPLRWLRITRTNNTFITYHGTDGVNWTISGTTTQAFATNLHIGMATAAQATSASPLLIRSASGGGNVATTATFTDFFVEGAQPGDDIVPDLVASIDGTTLRLDWEVTPRDFAVEVSTDLIEWTTVLLPIQEAAGGRSMSIPLVLGQSHLFARAVRVERIIVASQAKAVTQGLILSPGSGLTLATSTGSFCNNAGACDDPAYPVVTSSVYKSGTYNIPLTSTASVDTILSGTSVDTVLQVRNSLNLSCPKCSDNATGLGNKSLVKPLPTALSATARNYTVLVGASQSSTYLAPIQVYITY